MDLQINLKKDLEYDEKYSYTIHKTKKIVEIQSFKDPSIGNIKVEFDPNEWSVNTSFDEIMNEDKSQKKRHYFIYSNQPGYGKTTFVYELLQHLNASWITDFNNFSGVRENAQFLIFDDFSHESKLSYRDLCLLTGGNASFFSGRKKKPRKSPYIPRPDAQVIIFSNNHLFECIGKYDSKTRRRNVEYFTAKKMIDRFHIIKLDDEEETEIEDAVSHINVCQYAFCHPFDVSFDRFGYPIDKDGNYIPYSLACKFDTRYNKAFNDMKQSILLNLNITIPKKKLFRSPNYKCNHCKMHEHRFKNMCGEDMLKRYIDYQGRLNEFLECDIKFNILDYFLKQQASFQGNTKKYIEYIFENRHSLYECLASQNVNAVDIQGKAKKWYDPIVHQETLKIFDESNNIIQDRQMHSFFEFVMREINNPDLAFLVSQNAFLVGQKKDELLTLKRKRENIDE